MTWLDIPGWLSDAEGQALQMLATGARVLEIGSYLGRSTCCMAVTARTITAVDHHHGDDDTRAASGPAHTLQGFLANVEVHCPGKVQLIEKSIEDVDWSDTVADFDLVFIDAAHDPASVERHTRIALAVVRSGGTIAWHDWAWPTVRQGVWACGLEPCEFCDALAWMTV